ncbi:MAG TPA: hypothetical protein VFN51_03915 [Candidatus Saccharimonadales bacterium]|nr:hypothetical protein [Candidatus Saccharimonadales bacterium]
MSRTIQFLTLIVLMTLLIGCLIIPANPIFWLATATPTYTLVRAILIVLVYSFMVFGVPQYKFIRRTIAALSLALLGWALATTYNESIQLLDGLSIAAAGISLALSAIEPDYASRAEENWDVITSPIRPHVRLFGRRAAYYALVAFMLFDMMGRNVSPSHIRQVLS